MKKVLSAVIVCSLFFALMCQPAMAAAAPQMSVKCESVAVKPGDTVEVDLTVLNSPGFTVLNLAVLYDSENLTLTGIENKLTGFIMTDDSSFVWDGSSNFFGNGTLATLTFKVGDNAPLGDYQIKVNFFEASDYNGDDVPAIAEPGKISVKNSVVIPGDGNGDGALDTGDLVYMQKALFSSGTYTEALDINGDGRINMHDLLRFKKLLLL